jgi:hypothetical protein
MKTYLCPQAITLIDARKGTLQQVFLLILLTFFFGFTQAQELVFKNPVQKEPMEPFTVFLTYAPAVTLP